MMYRRDSRTVKGFLAVVAAVSLMTAQASAALVDLTPAGGNGTVSATTVLLSDLIADPTGGATVGDKIFTGFGYSFVGDMPTANLVSVQGLKDSAGNWGLRFQGPFLDLPGGNTSGAHVSYMVEIDFLSAQQGWRITDAHLQLHGVGAGEDSYFSIDETLNFAGGSGLLNTFFSTLGPATVGSPDVQLSDFELLPSPGVAKVNVVSGILAIASANSIQPARGTVFDQSFSQTLIPEPTTALLGLSGLAMVAALRRRRS